jgi:hypothetical protein
MRGKAHLRGLEALGSGRKLLQQGRAGHSGGAAEAPNGLRARLSALQPLHNPLPATHDWGGGSLSDPRPAKNYRKAQVASHLTIDVRSPSAAGGPAMTKPTFVVGCWAS